MDPYLDSYVDDYASDEPISAERTVNLQLSLVINSGHKGLIRSIRIDPTASCKYYITGSDDGTVRVWSTDKLKNTNSDSKHYQAALSGGHQMAVTDLLVNPTQTSEIFSCGEDKLALKWDLNKRKITNQFFGHSAGVNAVTNHPTIRDLIFTGSKDKTCKVWDARTKSRELLSLPGHKEAVNKVISFSTEPQIVTCSSDKTIRFYDLRLTGKCTKIISYHSNPIRTMCKGSELEGNAFVSASVNQVFSWDAGEGIPLTEFQVDGTGIINAMDVIDEGNTLLLSTDSGFKMFDYFSGQKVSILSGNGDAHDSRNILAAAYNRSLCLNGDPGRPVVVSSNERSLEVSVFSHAER